MRTTFAAPLVLLFATASAAQAQVRHEPITCVPGDRHVEVTTRAEAAAAVELQFRAEGSDWYGVAMRREDGVWSAQRVQAANSVTLSLHHHHRVPSARSPCGWNANQSMYHA